MRRGRILIMVLLIVIIGMVVAFFAIRQFFLAPPPDEQQVFVNVYYAAQNIPQGGAITEELLGTYRIPQETVAAVYFTQDELPLLLTQVAKFQLDQGVIITEPMVASASEAVPLSGPQWATSIPPGMTAVSIPANRLSLAGYAVTDGAHVNVTACLLFVDVDPAYQTILPNLTAVLTGTGFGSVRGSEGTGFEAEGLPVLSLGVAAAGSAQGRLELDPSVQQPYFVVPSEPQRARMVCQMLLQDVVVLKSGNFSAAPATTDQQTTDQQAQQQPTLPDIVTLIVSPQDSITLSYLMYTNAQINLTLRNPSDQSRLATEASTLQFLLSQYNIPVPAKLPYAVQPALNTLISPTLTNDIPPSE